MWAKEIEVTNERALFSVFRFKSCFASGNQTVSRPLCAGSDEVERAGSELVVPVPAVTTLMDAIRAAGIAVASDCREGHCGSCEVQLIAGDIDHRDRVRCPAPHAPPVLG